MLLIYIQLETDESKSPTAIDNFIKTGLLPPLVACSNSEMDGWVDRKTDTSILKPYFSKPF